jgi:hypothetical protein
MIIKVSEKMDKKHTINLIKEKDKNGNNCLHLLLVNKKKLKEEDLLKCMKFILKYYNNKEELIKNRNS